MSLLIEDAESLCFFMSHPMSLIAVMTCLAHILHVPVIECNFRFPYVLRCEQKIMMHDVSHVLPALFTYAAINVNPLLNIRIPAPFPSSAIVKPFAPFLCHAVPCPLLQHKMTSAAHFSFFCTQKRRHPSGYRLSLTYYHHTISKTNKTNKLEIFSVFYSQFFF